MQTTQTTSSPQPVRRFRRLLAASVALGFVVGLAAGAPAQAATDRSTPSKPIVDDTPLVLAHRGASGYRPEHTLGAYRLAVRQCADYIEPDVVSTADGVLVDRHEPEIGGTTDVEDHPEFADRETTKVIDGVSYTGWFTDDFTYAELRTLKAEERLPDLRPENTRFDRAYRVPTLDQVIELAARSRTCDGGRVGVIPETKHPTWFDARGLSLEEGVVASLEQHGYGDAADPSFIQSFEVANLVELDQATDAKLVQLLGCSGAPYDAVAEGDATTYADLVTPTGLSEVATYADAIGPCKDLVIPRRDGRLGEPTDLVADAHSSGLLVTPYTFRRENTFLPREFRSSSDPAAPGDLVGEIRVFLQTGIDGFFTDNPDTGREAVSGF